MPIDVPLRVLLVTDVQEDAENIETELASGGYTPITMQVTTKEEFRVAVESAPWDVVCTEYLLRDFSALKALVTLRQHKSDVPIIVVSDALDEDGSDAILSMGVSHCVPKTNLRRLLPAVERTIAQADDRRTRRRAEEALRLSEERYRELFENANDAVFTIDLEGNFTSFNRAGELMSGYRRVDLHGINMARVLTPASYRRAAEMIQRKIEDNVPTIYELDLIAHDGHVIALEVSTRLTFHEGVPSGIQGIARDVTDRKKAEAALHESEKRFRALFQNASDIVYTHDLDGNFTSVNGAVERITGYSVDEVLQMNIVDVVAPEYVQQARSMMGHKLRRRDATTYELETYTKYGRRVLLEVNSQLIYEEGRPVGVQGIARDITERHRVQLELQSRGQRQAAIAELGQRALAHTSLRRVFEEAVHCVTTTLNVPFCTITELSEDHQTLRVCAGEGWSEGIVGQATVPTGTASQAGYALLIGEPVIASDLHTETRFSVPDVVKSHRIQSGVSAIIHGSGSPFGVVSAFNTAQSTFAQTDVHFLQSVANVLAAAIERKRLEDERARHSTELATRVLQAQEEERKRIARELHDESAQSLSMLLTNLDLLEPHIPPDNEPLQSGFNRISTLAKRTLDETQALSHDLRPTILDDAGLIAALQWIAVEHEHAYGSFVRVHAEARHAPRLSSDVEVALFRIAQEALTNSGKYAHARRVNVALTFPDGAAQLVVKDNGKGFDPDSVSGPTRKGRLGLFGMRERAGLLGGSIEISSAPGKGTEVRVQLPLNDNDQREDMS